MMTVRWGMRAVSDVLRTLAPETLDFLFGVAATLLIDWSWIPLSPQQKESGRSLKEIKRSWGWDEETDIKDESLSSENRTSSVEENNESSFNRQ